MNAQPDQKNVESKEVLRERWRCWTEIVRLFALRKRIRYELDADNYHGLHQELLALCRQESSRAGLKEMMTIITPWITLDSLGWADPDVIRQPLHSAASVQANLDEGMKKRWHWERRRLSALCLGMSVIGIALLMLWWISSKTRWNAGTIGQTFRDISTFFDERGINQPLLFVGIAVAVLVIILVWLPGRQT
jgi:hypothetical protein